MKLRAWLDGQLRSVAVGRRFWPQLAEHKLDMLTIGGAALLGAALDVLRPWPLKWIVDGALQGMDGGARAAPDDSGLSFEFVVGAGVAAALVIALGRAAVGYFGRIKQAQVGHQVTRSLRHRIFAHLTELPLVFHAKNKSGDLLVRLMGDVPMLKTMLVDSSVALASRIVLILATLVVMLSMDALLTVVVFSVIPVLFIVVRGISRRISVAVQKQRKKEGSLADFMHEAVAGVAVIQALGRGPETVRRFARDNRRSARAGLKATRLAAGLTFTVEGMLGTVVAGTLLFGSLRVGPEGLSLGELLVFLSYVKNMLKPIRSAARHSEKLAKGTACGERVLEILDQEVLVSSEADAPPAPELPGCLEYDDVTYGYEPGRAVLQGFSARFERGEVVGLFGRSGAGKSTAAALALRLADPQAGAVRLDGRDLREFDLHSLRARFGLCMQETTLFGESVRENLLLGDPEADDVRLWAALEASAADGFVRALPEGLDSILDTAGGGLSGGQRRRLSLARTLLRASPLLIVDEPFSGLDRAAVVHVRDSLVQSAERGIVIVICHEAEHLELFDRVLFVEGGRVIDTGEHHELLARCARYRGVLGQLPSGVAS